MTDAAMQSPPEFAILPDPAPSPRAARPEQPASRAAEPFPAAERGRLVAIASGKGGVGKTWFAITLAHALTALNHRVLLIDGDLGLANVDIQLGLMPSYDIGSVIDGRLDLRAAVVRVAAGFDVLAGRSGSGSFAALDGIALVRILGVLQRATGLYETVILDLGAGLDPAVRRLALEADGVLLVVTDEPTSLTDAYAVMKLYIADHGDLARVRVVINGSTSRPAGEHTFATLSKACTSFLGASPALAGVILHDERVRDSIRRQTPLLTRYPAAPAARDVEAIARVMNTA